MSKNLIPIIAKILGVKIGEEFMFEGEDDTRHRFFDNELQTNTLDEDDYWVRSEFDFNTVVSKKIIKIPFEPKHREVYYTIDEDAWRVCWTNWEGTPGDYMRKQLGLVFRTAYEAEEAFYQKYKEYVGKEYGL